MAHTKLQTPEGVIAPHCRRTHLPTGTTKTIIREPDGRTLPTEQDADTAKRENHPAKSTIEPYGTQSTRIDIRQDSFLH